MFGGLREFIEHLKLQGEVTEIGDELCTRYKIPAAIKFVAEKAGSVVLFNKVAGYPSRVVGNLLGTRRRPARWPMLLKQLELRPKIGFCFSGPTVCRSFPCGLVL